MSIKKIMIWASVLTLIAAALAVIPATTLAQSGNLLQNPGFELPILHSEGARFLDIRTRLEALRARMPKPSAQPAHHEKPRRKKKISFI